MCLTHVNEPSHFFYPHSTHFLPTSNVEQTLIEITSRFYWLRGNCDRHTKCRLSLKRDFMRTYATKTVENVQTS